MLVDNKFIALSLPRCASTSFYITCLRNNINVEHYDEAIFDRWKSGIDLNLNNEQLADVVVHGHESISDLRKKFGNGYDIIGIRRNRYERFISLWKHVIDLSKSDNYPMVKAKLEQLTIDDILFYSTNDLVSEQKRGEVVYQFALRNNLLECMTDVVKTMVYILITPISEYHKHDPKIIWFDFDKLYELENWVSNKLEKPFILEKSNGSQHFECKLKIDDAFIERYDSIYNYYDLPKQTKTLL
jgi:hypothetical protein